MLAPDYQNIEMVVMPTWPEAKAGTRPKRSSCAPLPPGQRGWLVLHPLTHRHSGTRNPL